MRVNLGDVQLEDTELSLPGGDADPPRHLRLTRVTALAGQLDQGDGSLQLSDVRADALVAATAHWFFGTVELRTEGDSTFSAARLALETGDAPVRMDLALASADFESLEIRVGDVRVKARAQLVQARLKLGDDQGGIQAEHATLEQFELDLGELQVRVPRLTAERLSLSWGSEDGFTLSVQSAEGDTVRLCRQGLDLQTARLGLEGFELRGGAIHVLALDTERLDATLLWPEHPDTDATETPPTPAPGAQQMRVFDPRTLDALGGRMEVDARLDIRLPGGLRRKLQLPLKLGITQGSINFRELEHSLPLLEDSLFDFAVRDGEWLVLELGLPLLPTRGFGKRLLRWRLDADDQARAKRDLVRLSALPAYEQRSSGKSDAPPADEPRESSVRLEQASVKVEDLQLALPPPSRHLQAALEYLAFEGASLRGGVEYHREQPRKGKLEADLRGLEARLADLSVGERAVALELQAQTLPGVLVELENFQLRALRLGAEGLRLRAVRYR